MPFIAHSQPESTGNNLDRSNNNNDGLTERGVSKSIIYRLGHSDIFACNNCRKTGDKWYMETHDCSGKK
jgi:hypothetical protein